MSNIWPSILVRDLVENKEAEIKTGPFGTQLHASDYVSEGTPVINARNIGFGDIREEKLEYISDETVRRLSSHLLKAGDIVFGRKGTVERHSFIKAEHENWFQGTDCLRLRLSSNKILPRFASYFLLTEAHKQWIINLSSHGATMTSLNQDIIGRIILPLPPKNTQERIVDILSAYDDLIENNTRRIQILEEMAQAIYREWFVHFRYPGHEGTRMVESELGMIPEGWKVKPVAEAFETLGGGTPSTKISEYWENGDVTWFTPTDLTRSGSMFVMESEKKISTLGLKNSAAKMFPAYSVMMTSRATIGVTALNTSPACTNQGFITCIPNDRVSAYQIYFWIEQNKEKIDSIASGATYKEISRGEFREFVFPIADDETNKKFIGEVQPICALIENLQRKNINLRQQRDLLLPRLVSGEIEV